MEVPKRQFVGGIENVNAKDVYNRELANYQSTPIYGLNRDFLSNTAGIAGFINEIVEHKDSSLTEKESNLIKVLDEIAGIPKYADFFKMDKASQTPYSSAAFAEDVLPYIEAIDEIVRDMKETATTIRQSYDQKGFTDKLKRPLSIIRECCTFLGGIMSTSMESHVQDYASQRGLLTKPSRFANLQEEKPQELEALERIKKRLEFAKKWLKSRSAEAEGSFTYWRKDGNMTPVGWEPTDEERKKLAEKPKKIRP